MNKTKIRSFLVCLLVCALLVLQLSGSLLPMSVGADETTSEMTDSVEETTQESTTVTEETTTEETSAAETTAEVTTEETTPSETTTEATAEETTPSETTTEATTAETTPSETPTEETSSDAVSEDDKFITNDENGIPDANLYAILLNAGDRNSDGKLTVSEAKNITSLYFVFSSVGSYTNLAKYAPNITTISDTTSIPNAKPSDWSEETIKSFISEYPKLEKITSVYIVAADIDLINCVCSNQNLTYLSICSSGGTMSTTQEIEGLKHLSTNLQSFTLRGFKAAESLKDDTNLLDCENLSHLTLTCYNLKNVDGINKLEKLSWLALEYCYPLEALGDITDLPNLTYLSLRSDYHVDLSGLEKLTSLKEFCLAGCKMSSIPDISGMTNLETLDLSGNNFTKDYLVTVVPEKFLSDKIWLTDATMKSALNGRSYYTYMDDEILLSKIGSSNKVSVTVTSDCPIEAGTEFLQTIRNNKSSIEITNINEFTGNYRRSVIIDGSKLPENINEPIQLNGLIKTTGIPEDLLNKYKSVSENVIMKAYTVDGSFNKDYMSYSVNPDELINHGNTTAIVLYFYDKATGKSELVRDNISLDYNTFISSNQIYHNDIMGTDSYTDTPDPAMLKTEDEGFYYFVEKQYMIKDDEPETPSETETSTETEAPSETETPTETEAPSETETSTETEAPSQTETSTETEAPSETETSTEDGKSSAEVISSDNIISADNAKDTLTSSMENTTKPVVEAIVDKPIIMTKDLFEGMKNNNKSLTIGVVNENNELQYAWSFDYQKLDSSKMADIDLSIKFETEKQKEIEEITKQKQAFYISFAYHGELPAPAEVKTFVGNQYKDGETVHLYYYNEDTGKIESINGSAGLLVNKGYVTYTITHCSVYFLSTDTPDKYGLEKPAENPTEESTEAPTESQTETTTETSQTETEPSTESGHVSPSTGYNVRPEVIVILLLCCVMCGALLIQKSGKNRIK